MLKKVPPTAAAKRLFVIHLLIFIVINAIMWLTYKGGNPGWVYPWPAWITAAWALAVVGHACALWTSYEDKGFDEFIRQTKN
jgi:hypothetical protein